MHNVLELLRQKGIEPKIASRTKGGEYHSPCPGCGGDDRFHVWPDQNNGEGSWWCRREDKGGDNIQFLIEYDGLDFKQACATLDKDLPQSDLYKAPKIPAKMEPKRFQPSTDGPPPDLWQQKADKFVQWAYDTLIDNPTQRRYLLKRGITKKTFKKYRLGWNQGQLGKDMFRPRESWGLPTEYKDGRNKRLWLPIGLVIPLIKSDNVVRLRIRRKSDRPPPYYIIPGSNMDTMLINPDRRVLVVVESELDAILLDQEAGDIAGFVALGNASRKPDSQAVYALKKTSIVLLALDFDAAGTKSLDWWFEQFPNARLWPPSHGKDPGEAHEKHGVNLKEWIEAAYPAAWKVQQSLTGTSRLPAGPAKPTSETSDIPAGVLELAKLLDKYPVVIHATAQRTSIRASHRWMFKHWEELDQIQNLVFFSPEVFEYLDRHPSKFITGKNIIGRTNG